LASEDTEKLQEMAYDELEKASARFWARAGDIPDVHEHFAAACAKWLYDWTISFVLPEDTPIDPEVEQRVLDQLERAKLDLELQAERDSECG
jgi:hypothetical protein